MRIETDRQTRPCAKTSCLDACEDEADELSEGCWVHRFDGCPATEACVVVVDDAAGHARSLGALKVVVQELHLHEQLQTSSTCVFVFVCAGVFPPLFQIKNFCILSAKISDDHFYALTLNL